MKKSFLLSLLVLAAVTAAAAGEKRVLFYPAIVHSGNNLLKKAKFHFDKKQERCKAEAIKGSPFSTGDPAWRVESFQPESAYWRTRHVIQGGRTYLVGSWYRFANAKVLTWCYGVDKPTKVYYDKRIFYFGGFNSYLTPYFSPRTLQKLGGDPNRWRLTYRLISLPETVKDFSMTFAFGIYMATGSTDFASPFLIDVTDNNENGVRIDIANAKPIRKLTIVHTGLRDTVWVKEFPSPVTEYQETLSSQYDYRRGLDQNKIFGHALNVFYADGTMEVVFCPEENIFQAR